MAVVLWSSMSFAAPPKKAKPVTNFPRVDVYVEEDEADQKSGEDVLIDGDTKYGMGKRDHQPVVKRCTTPLDEKTLRALEVEVLPDFREPNSKTTLGAFFDALDDRDALRKLFPKKLDGARGLVNETRVTIVWLDEKHWFVDGVFHRLVNFDVKRSNDCTEVLDGTLRDFIAYSPSINARRTEGFAELASTKLVGSGLSLSLSAGMPNTVTYSLTVEPSGRFALSYGGFMPPAGSNGFDPDKLTALLVKAKNAGLDEPKGSPLAMRRAHDAQQTTLRLKTQISLDDPAAVAFVEDVKKAYGINPYPAR